MSNRSQLSLKEVAENLGVHKRTVTRWIDTRKVEVEKKKNRQGHLVFNRDDLKILKQYANSITKVV